MNAPLPRFVASQVDRFYRKRLFNHPTQPGHRFWYSLHAMGPDAINLQSNDYLGLADHPAIRDAVMSSLKTQHASPVMSQVILVTQAEECAQRRFEMRLGQFVGMGSGVLFQSGFDANVGLLQTVAQRGMPVYIDQHAHASLYQGIQLAQAAIVRLRHNDMDDLRDKLTAGGPGIIVVDSVYSVSGSLSPLREVADLAQEFDCLLVVDESHSLGTHGPQGRGLVVELGLTPRVHVVTASLAKAFAARAGFVGCSDSLTEYLRFTAFPSIFSSALLPHELAGLEATLDVLASADEARTALWRNTRQMREAVGAAGYDVGNGSEQIIGIRCGPIQSAVVLRDALESRGVFGSLFWYPATEWRQSVLRLSVNAGLQPRQVDHVAHMLRAVRHELSDSMPALGNSRARSAHRDSLLTSIS